MRISSYMSFHFLLTREERGDGQRVEKGGRLLSLSTHNLLIQSSHNLGRSEVKKKVSRSLFYIQTAAQMIHLFILRHNWKPSRTSDPGSTVKLEVRSDEG
ncbi:hypothetical protein PAMP_008847 [Pampus punctatissimus]